VTVLAYLDPPSWLMPILALVGPMVVVVLTLWRHRHPPPGTG
jgi:hypothetical protein